MAEYDLVLRGGTIYDGTGKASYVSDLAIKDDKIVAIEKTSKGSAKEELDASGLCIAPGFINMLSQAEDTLMADGSSQSDIRQGVTLEIMGEGNSMGPFTKAMKDERMAEHGDIKYDITWDTLRGFLDTLVNRGVSTNVASFVGASTARQNFLGREERKPTADELQKMCKLVEHAMSEGAIGVSSALIYSPGLYAQTDELIALAQAAAKYKGMYTSHLRSEGSTFIEALDEFIEITDKAKIRSEVYHLKAAGQANWHKMDLALERIEAARKRGLEITADMYMYTAAQTGLDAAMPPWVQQGGLQQWRKRLQNPEMRTRLETEMRQQTDTWENGLQMAGAEGTILVGFKNEKLKPLAGKSLAELAKMRGISPEIAAMDLIVEDDSRIETVYFWMSEDNLRKQIIKPWVSVGSDGSSMSASGIFMQSSTHPRAYGNVARFLSKYVRQEKLITLEEAVRRLTHLPASNMRLESRGKLQPGYFADLALFDFAKVEDNATFEKPHQYASGFVHVLVNGVPVIKDSDHTGNKPGRVVTPA
ncbi:MAG: D-aminoacylase [Candidatus Obscuribacterales bacterium]|nr:D-aminoacylase [Candidatus Obscuribacterales bacterium]